MPKPTVLCRRTDSSARPDARHFIQIAGTRPHAIAASRAWFDYDDEFLGVTFDFDEPLVARLPRAEADPPQVPWAMDSAELSVWVPREGLMYKFIVNSLGRPWARVYRLLVRRDPVQRGGALHTWKERDLAVPGGEFTVRTGKRRWEVRMRIPWRVLGSRKPRTDLAILVGRDRSVKPEASSWPAAFHFVIGGARDGFAALRLEGLKAAAAPSKPRLSALRAAPAVRPRGISSKEIIIANNAGMFPVAQKLADGSIGIVARDGAGHLGLGGYLRFWRSTDEGKTWLKPTVVTDGGPRDDQRNPGFGQMADGTLVVSYCHADKSYNAAGRYDHGLAKENTPPVSVRRSKDLGKTWSPPRPLISPHDKRFASPFGKICLLPDGTALMAVYGKGSFVFRSRDNGRTWGDFSLINPDFSETALLRLPSGRLLAALRGRADALWMSESSDDGYTWAEPRQLAGERNIPGDLIRLQSGEIILAHGYRHFPYGVRVLVSFDDGRTWRPRRSPALVWWSNNADTGYPSSVELSGGRFLTAYYGVRSRRDLTLGIFVGGVICRKSDLLKAL